MKYILLSVIALFLLTCCTNCKKDSPEPIQETTELAFGGDLSIIKKLEDYGAVYKVDGIQKKGLQIFKENN